MMQLASVRPGYIRLSVRLPVGNQATPGQMASACKVDLEHLGAITVLDHEAFIDVRHDHAKSARNGLESIGPTRVAQWNWQWLRLSIGRNHGFTLGQLKKLLLGADANPLGRIHVNNTHSLVGLHDYKVAPIVARLATTRINGYAVRPEALPPGMGPGSPAFVPH